MRTGRIVLGVRALAIAALFLGASAGVSRAQWHTDGIPPSGTGSLELFRSACPDDSGGVVVAWVDSLLGTSLTGVYVQRIDAEGHPRWGSNGVAVVGSAVQFISGVHIARDMDGGTFVTYAIRNGADQIYAQHVDSRGVIAWPAPVRLDSLSMQEFIATSDGLHGVAVSRIADEGDVAVSRLRANGRVVYANVTVSTSYDIRLALIAAPDGSGGVFVCYKEHSIGDSAPFMQCVDSLGTKRWANPLWLLPSGPVPPSGSYIAYVHDLLPDGQGGVWAAGSCMPTYPTQLTAIEHVSAAGVPLGSAAADPMPFCSFTGAPGEIKLAAVSPTTVWSVWSDPNIIRAARISDSAACGSAAVDTVVSFSPSGNIPDLVSAIPDDSAGVIVVYADSSGLPSQLYAQRVDPFGRRMWGNGGTLITPAARFPSVASAQQPAGTFRDQKGGIIVAWPDDRLRRGVATQVLAQHVPRSGLVPRTITVSVGPHGSFGGPSVNVLPTHSDFRVSWSPDANYYVSDVTLDQVSIGPRPNILLEGIEGDHQISVLFGAGPDAFSMTLPAEQYVGVSWPVLLGGQPPSAVLSPLGTLDPKHWRLWSWDPLANEYREANAGIDSITCGRGYWLASHGGSLVAAGIPVLAGGYSVPLYSGPGGSPAWNQIGNPYRFPIADTALRVSDGLNPKALAESTWTSSYLLEYSIANRAYVPAHVLLPGHAYWIKKKVGGVVDLEFPNESSSFTPDLETDIPAHGDWAIEISTPEDGASSTSVTLGATHAERPWRIASPPALPSATRSLVVRPASGDASSSTEDLGASLEPAAEFMEWDLDIQAAPADLATTLRFHFVRLAADHVLAVLDRATGTTSTIADGGSLVVPLHGKTTRLHLTVQPLWTIRDTIHPQSTLLVSPNPARANVLVRAYGFRVPTATLFDLGGRRVRVLSSRPLLGGGVAFDWDGQDEAGRRSAPGVYWIQCETQGRALRSRIVLLR